MALITTLVRVIATFYFLLIRRLSAQGTEVVTFGCFTSTDVIFELLFVAGDFVISFNLSGLNGAMSGRLFTLAPLDQPSDFYMTFDLDNGTIQIAEDSSCDVNVDGADSALVEVIAIGNSSRIYVDGSFMCSVNRIDGRDDTDDSILEAGGGTTPNSNATVCALTFHNIDYNVFLPQGQICIGDEIPGNVSTFTSSVTDRIESMVLVHKEGCFTCNEAAIGDCAMTPFWGCEEYGGGFNILLTHIPDQQDPQNFTIAPDILFPSSFDIDTDMSYSLTGASTSTPFLEINISTPFVVRQGQSYSFWHSDVFRAIFVDMVGITADNSSRVCADVYLTVAAPTQTDCHPDQGMAYNAACCRNNGLCYVNEGGCATDNDCAGNLVCGSNNCDNTAFGGSFPPDSRCCVDPCANFVNATDAIFDAQCCSLESPCPLNQGHCSADEHCIGDLVCGFEDSCDFAFNGAFVGISDDESPRCCIAQCADENNSNYNVTNDCCSAQNPCPAKAGNCTDHSDCFGDLLCVDDSLTCALGKDVPTNAHCCSRCEYGVDPNLAILHWPDLDQGDTYLYFDQAGEQTLFQVVVRVPHQYDYVKFTFMDDADQTATFESNASHPSNEKWRSNEEPCETIYTGEFLWEEFRETMNEERTDESVTYTTEILIDAARPLYLRTHNLGRDVNLRYPFSVRFDLRTSVNGTITPVETVLDIEAAFLEQSIVAIEPSASDDDTYNITAFIYFATSVIGEEYFLENGTVTSNNSQKFDLSGVLVEEDRDRRSCNGTDDCLQFWGITFTVNGCDLIGEFTVNFQANCRQSACALPIGENNDHEFLLTTSSDSVCGEVQVIVVTCGQQFEESTILCGDSVSGTVTCMTDDSFGGPQFTLSSTAIEQVIIYVFDDMDELISDHLVHDMGVNDFDFEQTMGSDAVSFSFTWDSTAFGCNLSATVAIEVAVTYADAPETMMLLSYPVGKRPSSSVSLAQTGVNTGRDQSIYLATGVTILAEQGDTVVVIERTSPVLPGWAIAVIVVLAIGVLCLGGIGAFVLYHMYHRRKRRRANREAGATGAAMLAGFRNTTEKSVAEKNPASQLSGEEVSTFEEEDDDVEGNKTRSGDAQGDVNETPCEDIAIADGVSGGDADFGASHATLLETPKAVEGEPSVDSAPPLTKDTSKAELLKKNF